MNFQHLWKQTRSTIFITLAVSFVLLDTWLIDSQQYLVTMYILIVTILIVFIPKRYQGGKCGIFAAGNELMDVGN